MLTLERIGYSVGTTRIIDSVSATLFPYGIVQINGEGGKEIAQILSGVNKSNYEGAIFYNRVRVNGGGMSTYATQICYVPRKTYFDESLTLRQNIEFWAQVYRCIENVDFALSSLEVDQFADEKVKNLSAETLNRASMCKVLFSRAPVWILENPFQWLSKEGCEMLELLMESRRQQKGLVIFTSPYYRKLRYNENEVVLTI